MIFTVIMTAVMCISIKKHIVSGNILQPCHGLRIYLHPGNTCHVTEVLIIEDKS